MGFDFAGSPFGKDPFDYWPMNHDKFTYQDVFNGFAFYKPLNEQKISTGIPGFFDTAFAKELLRRDSVLSLSMNKTRQWPDSTSLDELQNQFNVTRERPIAIPDSVGIQIDKWLK